LGQFWLTVILPFFDLDFTDLISSKHCFVGKELISEKDARNPHIIECCFSTLYF